MPFPIPPSYVEYATKPEVRTAVDHILSVTAHPVFASV